MTKLLSLIAALLLISTPLRADNRAIVASFHKTERGVTVYEVVDSSKRVLGKAYTSEVTTFRLARGQVRVLPSEVGFCPAVGRYDSSCYKFPNMEKALDWVRIEVK